MVNLRCMDNTMKEFQSIITQKEGQNNMIANYHTHTWRCKHAMPSEREYVEYAIRKGLKILGFSDHTPMPFPEEHISGARMEINQLEDYVTSILQLKDEYKNDIEIHLGLEVEFYPEYFEELLKITGQYPIEYFLLAQHYLGNEINDVYCGESTKDSMRLIRYCQQTKKALATGYFTYFAHPDLINYTGDEVLYESEIRDLCMYAKERNIPLEINFLGIGDRRHYPNLNFWKIAGEVGNQVIFGSDAHQPENVCNSEALSVAEQIVDKYGLELIDTVTLHNPRII